MAREKHNWILTDRQKAEAVTFYESGMNSPAIGRRLGIDQSSVIALLKRRGVKIRHISESKRRLALDESVFDAVTETSAYWIGFLMADGSVYGTSITITLATADSSHLESFRLFLGSGQKVRPFRGGGYAPEKTAARFSVQSKRLAESLARFGVIPNKTLVAKVIGLECDRHFWRGVVDGDGSIGLKPNRGCVYPWLQLVGSRPLMEQFAEFVRGSAAEYRGNVTRHKSIWAVQLIGTPAAAIIRTLYHGCTVALERKRLVAESVIARPGQRFERRPSASGFVGVYRLNRLTPWQAQFQSGNRRKTLGYFKTAREAADAVNEAYSHYLPHLPAPNP